MTLTISHRNGSYEVRFCSLESALSELPPNAFVITDTNVDKLYGVRIRKETPLFVVPPGETSKCIAQYERALRWLAQSGASRSALVVALGGGVVGDLAGFVAATYMRGIPYLQIPTTLLSQVDSSVGGKVGIDLPEGKNLVGAFYPPAEVAIALDSLRTLPKAQFVNGTAEVWKYAFAFEPSLMEEMAYEPLGVDSPQLESIVEQCIAIKAAVVQEDEFETTGSRARLNFGHTVGHALEIASGFELLHGEAISVGMVAEAALGEQLGITVSGTSDILRGVLSRQGLPIAHPLMKEPEKLIELMARDKKRESGGLAFALLVKLGECKLMHGVEPRAVVAALEHL